jgi:hypothetical protein
MAPFMLRQARCDELHMRFAPFELVEFGSAALGYDGAGIDSIGGEAECD